MGAEAYYLSFPKTYMNDGVVCGKNGEIIWEILDPIT